MKRRDFINLVALSPMTMLGGRKNENKRKPPNFVVIMADDLGPGGVGCFGNKNASTPHIDRLGEEGVIFTTCWAAPICIPSRAMMMTGRYARRTGYYHNALRIPAEDGSYSLHRRHITFSRALSAHGYASAVAGKWQLPGSPDAPGYDFDEYCLWVRQKALLPEKSVFTGSWEHKKSMSRYWHPALVKNGKLVPTTGNDFGPDICTDFLVDFIKRHKDRPFIVYYPMLLPHSTARGFPAVPGGGKPGEHGTFQQCSNYIDLLVGRILKCLEQSGLRENTLIIFTSDNPHAHKNKATGKGAGVPLVVAGKGIVKKRGVSVELASLADIFPTLLDFAGVSLPPGYEVDGQSLAPFLRGETDRHREWLFSYLGTARMLRDHDWVLEALDPIYGSPNGRFYREINDKSGSRYEEVTPSREPEILKARKRFEKILEQFPLPDFNLPVNKKILEKYHRYRHKHQLK